MVRVPLVEPHADMRCVCNGVLRVLFSGRVDDGSFKQYAGYIPVGTSKHLFYWFTEAQHANASGLPLILWLNGGAVLRDANALSPSLHRTLCPMSSLCLCVSVSIPFHARAWVLLPWWWPTVGAGPILPR